MREVVRKRVLRQVLRHNGRTLTLQERMVLMTGCGPQKLRALKRTLSDETPINSSQLTWKELKLVAMHPKYRRIKSFVSISSSLAMDHPLVKA